MQVAIAEHLDRHGFAPRREVILTDADRIDILVGRTGIEVKIAGAPLAVARQLQRYAHSPDIDVLILATTRASHCAELPPVLAGKPLIRSLIAGGAW